MVSAVAASLLGAAERASAEQPCACSLLRVQEKPGSYPRVVRTTASSTNLVELATWQSTSLPSGFPVALFWVQAGLLAQGPQTQAREVWTIRLGTSFKHLRVLLAQTEVEYLDSVEQTENISILRGRHTDSREQCSVCSALKLCQFVHLMFFVARDKTRAYGGLIIVARSALVGSEVTAACATTCNFRRLGHAPSVHRDGGT
ncbi:hypothetical protein BDI24065_02970 [Burkholderia diffusa]|uniref:Uncharacterized protein n=1 Tax=Burkholderia diffusa TaxID=488732 RepID=A0A6P2L8V0_9BURK|nr:hypothetical protein BDI24065_02970 [Burkholderia diffusa]